MFVCNCSFSSSQCANLEKPRWLRCCGTPWIMLSNTTLTTHQHPRVRKLIILIWERSAPSLYITSIPLFWMVIASVWGFIISTLGEMFATLDCIILNILSSNQIKRCRKRTKNDVASIQSKNICDSTNFVLC